METFYSVQADQIEVGDQVIIDMEPIEVTGISDDPEAPLEGIRITGYSHESGDTVTFDVYFADTFDVWGI